MRRNKALNMTLCALFAALTAVLTQIAIPIQPVPINLAILSVFIAAGLLGAKLGAVSQLIFLLVGAAGFPVFSGFSGGVGKLLGPTGGFLIGYVVCAFLTGLICDVFGRRLIVLIPAMLFGMIAMYLLGTFWFMLSTNTGFIASLSYCVFPFLLGDALKILFGSVLVARLSPILGSI